MKLVEKYPALGSSVDPNKLSLTVTGVLTGIIPVVILVGGFFGVTLDVSELNTLVEQVGTAIIAIWGAIGAVMTVIGGIRRIYNKFIER